MELAEEIWAKTFQTSEEVSLHWASVLAFLTCVVVLVPTTWKRLRVIVTVVHEFGHALSGVVTGGGLRGIKINHDTSGLTTTTRRRGPIGWVAGLLTTYIGYPAPGLVAVAVLVPVAFGRAALGFFILSATLTVMLLFMRNAYGFVVTLALSVASCLTFYYASANVHSIVLVALAWFLISGGLMSTTELHKSHLKKDYGNSDVYALTRGFKPAEYSVFISYYVLYAACATVAISSYFTVSEYLTIGG